MPSWLLRVTDHAAAIALLAGHAGKRRKLAQVLAEFGYGGVLKPSFPKAILDGTRPSRAAWFLKEKMLPPIYWKAMLRGKEWLAKPEPIAVTRPAPAAE